MTGKSYCTKGLEAANILMVSMEGKDQLNYIPTTNLCDTTKMSEGMVKER